MTSREVMTSFTGRPSGTARPKETAGSGLARHLEHEMAGDRAAVLVGPLHIDAVSPGPDRPRGQARRLRSDAA